MKQDDFDPFDPVKAAMGSLHASNLNAAKDAKIEQLESYLFELCYAGNECARVLTDIAESNQLDAIARAVVIATVARWKAAKEGR